MSNRQLAHGGFLPQGDRMGAVDDAILLGKIPMGAAKWKAAANEPEGAHLRQPHGPYQISFSAN